MQLYKRYLLIFLISSMIRLTPFVKLAVECDAFGSSIKSKILDIVVSETSSRDSALGPMTPASLELADIAMIALSTSATVPWICVRSIEAFSREQYLWFNL